MTRRRTRWRLRKKYGRASDRLARSVTSVMYRGKTIVLSYKSGFGYESEVVGDGAIYPGPSRDAAIAKAKRVIDAMKGD